jgi:hypothetical protein
MIYTVTCPQCNEENPGHKLQCAKCGANLAGLPRQAKQPPISEQSTVQALPNQRQIALLEEKIKVETLFKGGADNFFWIAGLSLVNSIIDLIGGRWAFLIGLGITQLVDGISVAIAEEIGANWATIVKIIAFVVDMGIAGVFVVFGILARRRHKWAFIIGMVLYALDGLILLIGPDWLGIGFHLFILYGLYVGLKSITKLHGIEQEAAG